MENNSCYTPLCPRRETCTLWLNALVSIDKGATQLCITNPKIIEEAGGYDHCNWRRFMPPSSATSDIARRYACAVVTKPSARRNKSPLQASLSRWLPGSSLDTRASKSIISSLRESRVGQRANYSNESAVFFLHWKVYFPALENFLSNLGKVIFQPWKKNRGI